MVFHLGFWSWAAGGSTPQSVVRGAAAFPELAPFTFWGRFGVEIFFAISGFVIAFSAASATPWQFIRARFLRLVPAAFVCATMTFVVAMTIGLLPTSTLVDRYIRTLTFNPYAPWIDGVYWSLGVEISFYVLIAALLMIRRFSWIEPVAAIIGTASSFFWLWILAATLGYVHPPVSMIDGRSMDLLMITYGAYFATGVFLWSSLMIKPNAARSVALLLFVAGGLAGIYMNTPAYFAKVIDPSLRLVPLLVWLFAISFIVLATRFDSLIVSRMGPATLAGIRLCGMATYPLYLLHDIIGAAVLRTLVLQDIDRFVALTYTFALMIALSLAVTLAVEPPFRKAFSRVIDFRVLRPPTAEASQKA